MTEMYMHEIEYYYHNGLKHTWACKITNLYEVDEDQLTEELIDAAFGC